MPTYKPCVDVLAINKAISDQPAVFILLIANTSDFFGVSPFT
jgi:hypothetical protein